MLLALLNLVLLLALRALIRRRSAASEQAERRLLEEIRVHSPARAAIAAVIASRGEDEIDAREFRKEVEALLAQWPKIESLAERAGDEITRILGEDDPPAGKRRAGPGTHPPARRRRRRRGL